MAEPKWQPKVAETVLPTLYTAETRCLHGTNGSHVGMQVAANDATIVMLAGLLLVGYDYFGRRLVQSVRILIHTLWEGRK